MSCTSFQTASHDRSDTCDDTLLSISSSDVPLLIVLRKVVALKGEELR